MKDFKEIIKRDLLFQILENSEMNNQILHYLKEHDYISIKGLELYLDIPLTTLDKAKNGNRLIPKRHVYKVYNHLFKPIFSSLN